MPDPSWTWRLATHAYDLDADGHVPAVEVTYDNGASGLAAADLQGAVDELAAGIGSPVVALDDLTDVVILAPVAGQRLRYDGSEWRNSSLKWKPVLALDPTSGLYVNVHSGGDPVMAEG